MRLVKQEFARFRFHRNVQGKKQQLNVVVYTRSNRVNRMRSQQQRPSNGRPQE